MDEVKTFFLEIDGYFIQKIMVTISCKSDKAKLILFKSLLNLHSSQGKFDDQWIKKITATMLCKSNKT